MRTIHKTLAAAGLAAVVVTPALAFVGQSQAVAKPNFQMPFRCGYTATAATFGGHSPANAVDFQKAGITGDPVLASAGGTVSRVANEGSTSYGRWIEINHGGGYTTRYAHLSAQQVRVGQKVALGTQIGKAGATGGVSGPHLHFEERRNGAVLRATLNGRAVPYPGHTPFTSRNKCTGGGGGGNPYTPQKACGSGFAVVDSKALGKAGRTYLLYNKGSGKNCVTTLKSTSLGKKTAASAFLEVKGAKRTTDAGNFSYYAGPVIKSAAGKCVKWGGSVGATRYASPFEHCG
ncbi:M23 family metallopeptidase [Luteipulveratus flavus]|uniref:M23 family metallopeptidase n=1 Tax=Luteipulveratus flavus TaxID=3031728 RepID=A0ABT6C9C2_9MICO|nr:M23 family metallopeptidase [Luteipulveratus sp. YIM 133296]MDF8265490.1 M23 family metallopeptidase [Luteipulveratus sp. YIM 133296]